MSGIFVLYVCVCVSKLIFNCFSKMFRHESLELCRLKNN